MQIHFIFYINLLSLIENNIFSDHKLESRFSVIVIDKKHKVYIKNISDLKIIKQLKNLLQYLVK